MNNPSPRSRRHFFRYSLRTVMLLFTASSIAFGWPCYKARQQRFAVAALAKVGCQFDYANYGPLTTLEYLRMWLGEREFRNVFEVRAPQAMNDAEMVHLQGLTQVKSLLFDNSQVSDAGLAYLHGLTQLEDLYLSRTRVTDAGLVHLTGLYQLRCLVLFNTRVSDAGVLELQTAVLPNCHVVR